MTEEQIEEQIINLEKMTIEHGEGFEKYLENQENILKLLGQDRFSPVMKQRIKILEEWAKKNDFVKSKLERYGL